MAPIDDSEETCARCGVALEGQRVIVLHGTLVIMFCTACGKKEAHAATKSGTHALDLAAARRAKSKSR